MCVCVCEWSQCHRWCSGLDLGWDTWITSLRFSQHFLGFLILRKQNSCPQILLHQLWKMSNRGKTVPPLCRVSWFAICPSTPIFTIPYEISVFSRSEFRQAQFIKLGTLHWSWRRTPATYQTDFPLNVFFRKVGLCLLIEMPSSEEKNQRQHCCTSFLEKISIFLKKIPFLGSVWLEKEIV